jgi:hypothetical protein
MPERTGSVARRIGFDSTVSDGHYVLQYPNIDIGDIGTLCPVVLSKPSKITLMCYTSHRGDFVGSKNTNKGHYFHSSSLFDSTGGYCISTRMSRDYHINTPRAIVYPANVSLVGSRMMVLLAVLLHYE